MKKRFGKNRKCKQCGGEPVWHVSLFGPLVGLRCPETEPFKSGYARAKNNPWPRPVAYRENAPK